ncbi:type II toxin-antitoxin system RelE/ParE family toxin [Bosea lathyri]|uniref:Toxin n=1 Tax=Bosea lathyri TaxID=1036778 RepID=A0A1H6A1M7_9HYPH|nr:type II toxin-antitoxin system RelE/ParE family toxin [Bosea lathyri]SEG42310.1 toxin ParE1/3/4 [Bosea lathyri]
MALRLTRQAEQDLDDIYVDSAGQFGLRQAAHYGDSLDACLNLLATHPFMARERTELTGSVRVHAHGSHLVVYEIERGDVVVLRVLHQRCDWEGMI